MDHQHISLHPSCLGYNKKDRTKTKTCKLWPCLVYAKNSKKASMIKAKWTRRLWEQAFQQNPVSIPLCPSILLYFSSVLLFSHVQIFLTPWIAARQASLSITNSWSLLKPMSIELVMPSSHLILCHPLLLLPPIPPSIRVFSNESTLYMRWPKYWSFTFSISPSNEHPGLIFFRMDWLDLLAVQGTLQQPHPHYILIYYILMLNLLYHFVIFVGNKGQMP